jgi:putative transposase
VGEGLSLRRACNAMGISRRGYGLASKEGDRDAELRERLRAAWRPNMGYRTAHALVRRELSPLNVKRVHRVWKEERLGRMKRYRKRRTGSTVPLSAKAANEVWCLDFVFDACLNGTKLKILGVKDEFTKECLALEVETNFKALCVQRVLQRLIESRGAPAFLRSDNGSEFIARTLAVFLATAGTGSHFIKPGSPWQNGFIESFNSRLRAECLDVEAFYNLADAKVKLAEYRRYYNEERPHSSLDYAAPAAFAALLQGPGRASPSPAPEEGSQSSPSL